MRILHVVTRSEFGGAQGVVRTLAEAQSAQGHSVGIAAGLEGFWEAFAGMDRRVESISLPLLVRAIRPKEDLMALVELGALFRRWKPDIVHLHTSKAGALGRLAAGVDRRHIVYTMHGYDQIRVLNRRMLFLDKLLAKRCGAVVAVSRLDADAMKRDGYTVELIPNGVSQPVDSMSAQAAAIDRLRSEGLPIVIMAARDARPKRIDLCRALASRFEGKAHFAWIGGEPMPTDPPAFHALGSIPQASSLLSRADVFLLCSDNEGMPLSLLEAMAAGLPVVASCAGGIPEVLSPEPDGGSAAGFVLPNDIDRMSSALNLLIESSARRRKMGTAGRNIWKTRYASDIMVNEYNKLYERLLTGKDVFC